jgi:hypothetical protein
MPDLEARLPGETIYNAGTQADRAAELLADDAIFLDEAITRREEWMCRSLLINGNINVTADNGYTNNINYMESAAGTPNNHFVPTTKWDQAGSDPLADLELARLAVIRDSGISPNVALFGATAKSVFINNANVSKFLDSIRFQIAHIEPIIQDAAVVRFGYQAGLEYYTYAEYFEDDAGTLYPMLPPELVLLASTNTPNKIVYGAYTQLEDIESKRFVTYQTSRIPYVYGDKDGSQLYYRLTSCPLPMPVDVLGWRIVEAITGVSYPFPTPGSIPYFNPNKPEEGPEEAQPQGKEGVDFFPSAAALEKEKGEKGEGNNASLDEHTVDELREIADKEGVDLSGATHKADIIKAIKKERKNKNK